MPGWLAALDHVKSRPDEFNVTRRERNSMKFTVRHMIAWTVFGAFGASLVKWPSLPLYFSALFVFSTVYASTSYPKQYNKTIISGARGGIFFGFSVPSVAWFALILGYLLHSQRRTYFEDALLEGMVLPLLMIGISSIFGFVIGSIGGYTFWHLRTLTLKLEHRRHTGS
jgi:hypothetical protein